MTNNNEENDFAGYSTSSKILLFALFFFLGILNHLGTILVMTGGRLLTIELNMRPYVTIYTSIATIFSIITRMVNSKLCLKVSYKKRVLIICFWMMAGYLSMFLVLTLHEYYLNEYNYLCFLLSFVPCFFLGSSYAFGEGAMLAYLRLFPKTLIGGWSSGTGVSGIISGGLNLLTQLLARFSLKYLYLILTPVGPVYLFLFLWTFKLLKKDKDTLIDEIDAEDIETIGEEKTEEEKEKIVEKEEEKEIILVKEEKKEKMVEKEEEKKDILVKEEEEKENILIKEEGEKEKEEKEKEEKEEEKEKEEKEEQKEKEKKEEQKEKQENKEEKKEKQEEKQEKKEENNDLNNKKRKEDMKENEKEENSNKDKEKIDINDDIKKQIEDLKDEKAMDDMNKQNKTMNCNNFIEVMRMCGRVIINLGFIYFTQFVCINSVVIRNSNKIDIPFLPLAFNEENKVIRKGKYEFINMFFQLGMFTSKTFIKLVRKIQPIEIYTIAISTITIIYFIEYYTGFLPYWAFPIINYILGFFSGGTYAGGFYVILHSGQVLLDYKELTVNVATIFNDTGTFLSGLVGYWLLNFVIDSDEPFPGQEIDL